MTGINKKSNIKILSILLLGVIVLGFISTDVFAAISYNSNLAKGTEEFTVSQYDEISWNTVVGSSLTPNDLFQGDSNLTNAKSKITLKGWTLDRWQLYDWLVSLFFPLYYTSEEIIPLLGLMETQGFNETSINADYNLNYTLWYGLRSVWNFTVNEYEENPSYTDGIIILQNPKSYTQLLEDYNNISSVLNGNIAIQLAGYTFSNLTADDFLWKFALNGFAIAEPNSDYLNEIVDELGCENATAMGSTLIFNRNGATNFTVEITYGLKGMITSFTIKDTMESTIFRIVSSNSEWIFFLLFIITTSIVIGLALLITLRKIKKKK